MNTKQTIERLKFLVEIIPQKLMTCSSEEFKIKKLKEKWSKQEILGHLIDSATNNHQRFIRMQYGDFKTISYDQNEWNKLQGYNDIDKDFIINFWTLYNKHIVHILEKIPQKDLSNAVPDQNCESLEWYIDHYVEHQEHHLHQIIDY